MFIIALESDAYGLSACIVFCVPCVIQGIHVRIMSL